MNREAGLIRGSFLNNGKENYGDFDGEGALFERLFVCFVDNEKS